MDTAVINNHTYLGMQFQDLQSQSQNLNQHQDHRF